MKKKNDYHFQSKNNWESRYYVSFHKNMGVVKTCVFVRLPNVIVLMGLLQSSPNAYDYHKTGSLTWSKQKNTKVKCNKNYRYFLNIIHLAYLKYLLLFYWKIFLCFSPWSWCIRSLYRPPRTETWTHWTATPWRSRPACCPWRWRWPCNVTTAVTAAACVVASPASRRMHF